MISTVSDRYISSFLILMSSLLLLASCQVRRDADSLDAPGPISTAETEPIIVEPTPREVLESHSNRSIVGTPGRNKIEIEVVKNGAWRGYHPTNLGLVRFYSLRRDGEWELRQTFAIDDDAIEGADPKYEDFNNDGLRDTTFISGQAARGANVRRTLLIYDKTSDNLVHVGNSADYPNLEYDRTLKCITSWMFSGSTTTVFLRLQGDTLQAFASVDEADYITVTKISPNGDRMVISRTKNRHPDDFIRYSTFDPVGTK